MSDLFQGRRDGHRAAVEPLASRMRPRTLDEVVGQPHLLGPGKLLRRMLTADRLGSMMFYGPPGVGKTTLAELVASASDAHFERGNAAAIGVKDVRFVLENALRRLDDTGRRTVFFLDEIHRFNKAQQDVLLGDVERGRVVLVGATTENPAFAVNSALVSRSQVFALEPLGVAEVTALLDRALTDRERGLGVQELTIEPEALTLLATRSDGDARRALTALEIAAGSLPDGRRRVTLDDAEQSIQQKLVAYDRDGMAHHDAISAFIKSVRGSDPDAALYWLAVMLHAGEDPMFIARRIAVLASEDIGNADPRGLTLAAAAYDLTHRVGMPECRIVLAQATTYLACAPKSNASYAGINAALADVVAGRTVPVPKALRSAKNRKDGSYAYPHDHAGGHVEQDYLGVEKTYYRPTDRGYEARMAMLQAELRGEARPGPGGRAAGSSVRAS